MAVSGRESTERNSTREFSRRMGIKCFVICSSLCLLVYFMNVTYVLGATRMIEKQFGLTAEKSGTLDGIDNGVAVPMQLVWGYLGDKWSKPKLIALGASFMALSNFVAILPQFVLSRPSPQVAHIFRNSSIGADKVNRRTRMDILCDGPSRSNDSCNVRTSGLTEAGPVDSEKAFYILAASRAIYGFGSSTQIALVSAYIYENSGHHRAALYIGITNAVIATGPVIGYMFSGYTNRLPLDLKDYSLSPRDPRFIGCWWLGFVVMGTIGLVACIPVFCFPANLKGRDENENLKGQDKNENKGETDLKHRKSRKGCAEYFKDMGVTLKTLLGDPLYVLYTMSRVVSCYVLVLFARHIPRYLEFHFRFEIYKSNLITGGAFTVPAVVGSFLGGVLISYFKLRDVSVARMIVCLLALGAAFMGAMMALSCPQIEYNGTEYEVTTASLNISTTCSVSCGCDTASAQPVCGSDGRDYFTPCHAGCTNVTYFEKKANFTNCKCMSGGWAVPGTCQSSCDAVIPYIVLKSLSSFSGALIYTPFGIILMSSIPSASKGFGYAFCAFLYNLIVFMPGPIISGALVDRSCLIWGRLCGRRGSCLLYDVTRLRNYTHGGGIAATLLSAVLATIAVLVLQKKQVKQKKDADSEIDGLSSEPELERLREKSAEKRNHNKENRHHSDKMEEEPFVP